MANFEILQMVLGAVYSAEEFNKLYNDLVSDGWKEQDYKIAGNGYIRRV